MPRIPRRRALPVGLCTVAAVCASCAATGPAADRERAADLPRVFCLDARALARTKARIAARDTTLQPALRRLIAQADRALRAGPFSVMEKTLTPPSGDKHDYMSFGPYWWPDPDRPDGLPYIRRDGEVNPETVGDRSDRTALERLVSSVETLSLAWYLTGRDAYAERAALLLRVWFLDPASRMNPHLEYGEAVPGRVTGRGIGICNTVGLPRIVDAIGLLGTSPAWTATDQAGMVAWCRAYLRWLRESPYGRAEDAMHNNHATSYDAQVAALALFTGETDIARRVLEAVKTRRIATQIGPDGSQPHELARTRSFSYSVLNLEGLFRLAALGERVGVDLWHYETPDGRSLRKAIDFMAPFADPERAWPHPQITPVKRSELFPLLRRAALAYDDGGYEDRARRLPVEEIAADRAQLLYPRSPPSGITVPAAPR